MAANFTASPIKTMGLRKLNKLFEVMEACAPSQPDGTRLAIMEIDRPALFPLFDTAARHRL